MRFWAWILENPQQVEAQIWTKMGQIEDNNAMAAKWTSCLPARIGVFYMPKRQPRLATSSRPLWKDGNFSIAICTVTRQTKCDGGSTINISIINGNRNAFLLVKTTELWTPLNIPMKKKKKDNWLASFFLLGIRSLIYLRYWVIRNRHGCKPYIIGHPAKIQDWINNTWLHLLSKIIISLAICLYNALLLLLCQETRPLRNRVWQ